MLPYIIQGLILGATAAAQPGAFQAFLLSLLARDGWRRTLPAAFAPLLSDGPILVLVLLVLTRLPEGFLSGLRIGGGLFLLYLAWGAWRSLRQTATGSTTAQPAAPGSLRGTLTRAALMNFLSPGPYLFWATVAGPILLEAWRRSPAFGLGFLISFYVAIIGGLMVFILVFAGAGRIDPRVNRALGVVSVVGLLGFGLYQLVTGVGGLMAGPL
ncbi:Lysine exporter protein (LYSE/YGGA) [Candidatus Promineifilum breve]|uniref:Lysine exporter protein (LYSE/YGGA) n=1 Tax=Candidatus Promineifilum breve TaxID=1806508 RepID=A0A160T5V5_9CHLR|nr:LysE family transporter [Candidatus Promineifilum breve]CUS05354.2 Lysine exporter protein (LYSE/YGGA) [Candidatus Promineifilum breve]